MKLLEFPHSHYCEKARWALDYKSIAFQPVAIMPGFHVITVRKYAPDTSVPVLLDQANVIQGSGEIIDYLDQHYPDHLLTPDNDTQRRDSLEIEHAMDRKLGENLRKILYNDLLAYPDFIRYCFTHPMPRIKQFVFSLIYPVLRRKIYDTYVVSDARVLRAKREFRHAMDELATRLNQQQYLVGEQFSRADLSVASMLCWLVMPAEHPFPWRAIPDANARAFYDEYQQHPVCEWVSTLYRHHRLPAGQPG